MEAGCEPVQDFLIHAAPTYCNRLNSTNRNVMKQFLAPTHIIRLDISLYNNFLHVHQEIILNEVYLI